MDAHQRWIAARGDETLRLNYNLNSNSTVVDAGGYKGGWTSAIWSTYSPTIYIFEPVKSYYDGIASKFSGNNKIKVHNSGLSNKDEEVEINVSTDSSSVYVGNGPKEKIILIDFIKFVKDNNINKIDLIKINIEGGEYDLLETIIKNGYAENITDIQVQFHGFVENSIERRNLIRSELEKTHYLTYDFEFIWENWKKKN